MIEILLLAITSLMVGFSGAIVPGPVFALTVSESAKIGFIAGPLIVAGHILIEAIVIAALILGLGPILKMEATVMTISFLGGIMLLWMGFRLFTSSYKKRAEFKCEENLPGKKYATTLGGVILSVSNPYFFIWWATIGGSLLVRGMAIGLVGIIAFAIGHWASDLSWYSFVSLCVSKGREFMTGKTYRIIFLVCGGFLLVLGIIFLKDGISYLLLSLSLRQTLESHATVISILSLFFPIRSLLKILSLSISFMFLT